MKSKENAAFWTSSKSPSRERIDEAIANLGHRWREYETNGVDEAVSPIDDMLESEQGKAHYLFVGRSALQIITEAMLLAGRTELGRVLDMPCGGGRVTRHLVKFFPEAKIFVDDLVEAKRETVRDQFKVELASCPRDFKGLPVLHFDLIFVGSLLTHLNEILFKNALDFLLASLNPGGLLIATTLGRFAATTTASGQRSAGKKRKTKSTFDKFRKKPWAVPIEDVLGAIEGSYLATGFGYTEYSGFTQAYGASYGVTFVSPSWLMKLIQQRTDAAVLGFKERGFDGFQDTITLQKLAP
jgi:SAM-dependent methyltransferase